VTDLEEGTLSIMTIADTIAALAVILAAAVLLALALTGTGIAQAQPQRCCAGKGSPTTCNPC
jgi:hypothetical protein